MKRIIDGKVYNTETSELIEEWSNGLFANDFNHAYENLYKSKKGQLFMTGNTVFVHSVDNIANDICLMTEENVLEWMQLRKIDADLLIKLDIKIEEG
jgi:hypothetical protein